MRKSGMPCGTAILVRLNLGLSSSNNSHAISSIILIAHLLGYPAPLTGRRGQIPRRTAHGYVISCCTSLLSFSVHILGQTYPGATDFQPDSLVFIYRPAITTLSSAQIRDRLPKRTVLLNRCFADRHVVKSGSMTLRV